jgi:hypothetical protein
MVRAAQQPRPKILKSCQPTSPGSRREQATEVSDAFKDAPLAVIGLYIGRPLTPPMRPQHLRSDMVKPVELTQIPTHGAAFPADLEITQLVG